MNFKEIISPDLQTNKIEKALYTNWLTCMNSKKHYVKIKFTALLNHPSTMSLLLIFWEYPLAKLMSWVDLPLGSKLILKNKINIETKIH